MAFKYATLENKQYRLIPMEDWPAVREALKRASAVPEGGVLSLSEAVRCHACGAHLSEFDEEYPDIAHAPDCVAVKYAGEG